MNPPTKNIKPPILERIGHGYFQRRSKIAGEIISSDEIHILNPDELRKLRRIERGVVLRAFLAGAFSAMASAIAVLYTFHWLGDVPANADWKAKAQVYLAVYATTIIATIIEIAFLYWDGLRSVHALALAAGLDLGSDKEESRFVLNSLVRAALEIPNPVEGDEFIDPRKENPKWRFILVTIIYKLKVSVSNLIIKLLVSGLGGRLISRAWLDFVAIPVTGAWDALISFWVIREARIRAMGPSAITEMLNRIFADGVSDLLSGETKNVCFRAVASSVVRTRDFHPNHSFLFNALTARFGKPAARNLDNSLRFLATFKQLPRQEKQVVMKVLIVAIVADGKVAGNEIRLYERAAKLAGMNPDTKAIHLLRKRFVQGKDLGIDWWEQLAIDN